ncbi:MAG: hypothetical protein SFV81_26020 [Pirellulaceae bacterium]|nr:hypothetical protein [Pirellulaceae bacterium]
MRREDPLGIRFPSKKHYPEWYRLGDEAFSGFDVDSGYLEPIDELIAEEGAAEPLFIDLAHLDVEIAERQAELDEISPRPPKNQKGNRKKRPKPKPLPTPKSKKRKPVFSKRSYPKNSLRFFLRTKKTQSEKKSEGGPQLKIRNERKQLILDTFKTHARLTVSQAISLSRLYRWQFRPAWEELLADGEIVRNGKLKQKNGPLTQMFSLKGVPQVEQVTEQETAANPESNQPTPSPKKKLVKKKKAPAKKVAKGKPEPTAFDQLALAGRFADSCGGISKAIQLLTVLQSMRK